MSKELEFGDYVNIEQKRFGCDNEMYIHKVIGVFASNSYVPVPVQTPAENIIHSGKCVPVVACICCGVEETDVRKYRIADVKLTNIHHADNKHAELQERIAELESDLQAERERIDDLQEINDSLVKHSNKRIAELEAELEKHKPILVDVAEDTCMTCELMNKCQDCWCNEYMTLPEQEKEGENNNDNN